MKRRRMKRRRKGYSVPSLDFSLSRLSVLFAAQRLSRRWVRPELCPHSVQLISAGRALINQRPLSGPAGRAQAQTPAVRNVPSSVHPELESDGHILSIIRLYFQLLGKHQSFLLGTSLVSLNEV